MGELKFTHFYFINMDYDKILLNIFLTNSGRSKYVLKKLNNYSNIKNI